MIVKVYFAIANISYLIHKNFTVKKILTSIKILLVLLVFQSCGNSSKEVFDRSVLNANAFTNQFSNSFFEEMKSTHKQNKSHAYSSAEEFLKKNIAYCEDALEKVKNLKKTKDSEELIGASENFMSAALHVFNTDYMNVAKMIDAKKSETEIDASIDNIYSTHDAIMKGKYDRLKVAASKYAKENDIKFIAR